MCRHTVTAAQAGSVRVVEDRIRDTLERSLRAQAAAHAMHARHDPHETTKAANAALWVKYERQADPSGQLEPEERRRRARHLMQADLARGRLAALRRRREEQVAAADAALAQELVEVAP
jgi:hypothetical protein